MHSHSLILLSLIQIQRDDHNILYSIKRQPKVSLLLLD